MLFFRKISREIVVICTFFFNKKLNKNSSLFRYQYPLEKTAMKLCTRHIQGNILLNNLIIINI